jgi:hypothetical protein
VGKLAPTSSAPRPSKGAVVQEEEGKEEKEEERVAVMTKISRLKVLPISK